MAVEAARRLFLPKHVGIQNGPVPIQWQDGYSEQRPLRAARRRQVQSHAGAVTEGQQRERCRRYGTPATCRTLRLRASWDLPSGSHNITIYVANNTRRANHLSDVGLDDRPGRSAGVERFTGRETFPQKSGKAPPGKAQNDVPMCPIHVSRSTRPRHTQLWSGARDQSSGSCSGKS
jgi:hypothetical protein